MIETKHLSTTCIRVHTLLPSDWSQILASLSDDATPQLRLSHDTPPRPQVYELVAARRGAGPETVAFCDCFAPVVAAYRARDFARARALAAGFAARFPADRVAPVYLQRCDRLILDPPPPNWDFTVTYDSK